MKEIKVVKSTKTLRAPQIKAFIINNAAKESIFYIRYEMGIAKEGKDFYICGLYDFCNICIGDNKPCQKRFHIKKCSNCINHVEYPDPHTCDICTSLNEEDFCMWESNIK